MAFIKHNLNPKNKKCDDCAVRAVGLATGIGWDDAFLQLSAVAFEYKMNMDESEVLDKVLKDNGFTEGVINVQGGDKRPTVAEFAEQNPNWYAVLRVANHIVATGKGNYVDTEDCGKKAIYKYWYKPIKNKLLDWEDA